MALAKSEPTLDDVEAMEALEALDAWRAWAESPAGSLDLLPC